MLVLHTQLSGGVGLASAQDCFSSSASVIVVCLKWKTEGLSERQQKTDTLKAVFLSL